MTFEERDIKLRRLDDLLTGPKPAVLQGKPEPIQYGYIIAEVWIDELWECVCDSFEEFLDQEYDMTFGDAVFAMKMCEAEGLFEKSVADRVNEALEKL